MVQDTSHQDEPAGGRVKLFTRSFIFAALINLLIAVVFFTLVTAMAVFAATEFGAGETAAGFAASAFVVGALVARFMAGKWVNTLGRRRALLISMLVYTVAALAYMAVNSYEMLLALRLIHGMALGFGQTALTAAVFDIIPRSRRGEGAGYFMLATTLPPAIGPLLAIQLTERFGFEPMFITLSVMSAVAFLLGSFMKIPEIIPPNARLRDKLRLSPRDIIEPRAFAVASVAMLLGVGFSSIMTFLNGYARDEGMMSAASLFFLIYSAFMIASRIISGRIQDRFGDNMVLIPAILSFAVAMVFIAWLPGQWALLLAGALAGVGFGALMPALQALITFKITSHRISIGLSTFFIMMDTGFGFAPLLLGPVVEAWGYQAMYAGCVGVILLGLGVYWLVHGRHSVVLGVARRGPRKGEPPPRTTAMPQV